MSEEGKILLQIEHMKKSFDGVEILKDISLSVREGEVVSIIGPSGSGKSTLLRCATMLETMDGGTLSYLSEKAAYEENGRCIYAPKAKLKEIHKNFGLVFQNFNLFPHYSVMKNITDAPVVVDKVPKKEAEERAESFLHSLAFLIRRMLIRASFPGASSRGYRSQGHWRCSRRSCFLMSQLLHSIRS